MMPKKTGSRRYKVLLLYAFAVVFPGIFLGFMAYRGVLNDQALREKENLRKLDSNSRIFFAGLNDGLLNFMELHSGDSALSFDSIADSAMLILYVRDSMGAIRLITHQLLYLPTELLTVNPEEISPQTGMQEGLQLEFINHDYEGALRFYQNRVAKTNSEAEGSYARIAIARLYKKLGEPVKAKATYEEIQENHSGCLLNGQIPLGLTTGLEILKINQASGEQQALKTNSAIFLELMLHPACEYDENQFDHFYQSFGDIIREPDPEIDSLVRELEFKRGRTEHLIRILIGQDPLKSHSKNYPIGDSVGITRVPISSNDLIAMYLLKTQAAGYQIGLIIDFQAYLISVAEKLISGLDPDNRIDCKIEDKSGHIIFSNVDQEEADFLIFPFPEDLPQLVLLLRENQPGFLGTLLTAGSGFYLVSFIMIILLMAIGFVFTMYTLNEEIRFNRLKSEFISNVSHELKSPLTSIRMMTEMLHDKRVPTEDRKSQYYSVMLDETEHLSHLIDNILDFSRLEDDRKKYQFQEQDLKDLLEKFLESLKERLLESGFRIRFNHPDHVPFIMADKDALHQVFYNLVDNAMKYSGSSRDLDVNLAVKEDEIEVSVKDYGIGISRKDQEKIFERFYRSDEPQMLGIQGSGIGLTIVKRIVEAHKGHLTLVSKPGEGSTFCIHLPINKDLEP